MADKKHDLREMRFMDRLQETDHGGEISPDEMPGRTAGGESQGKSIL